MFSTKPKSKPKNKHAPSEVSSKEPVRKIRNVPGLDTSKYEASKFGDIRFDKSMGKANEVEVRKNYKFLDDYRNQEIKRIGDILKDPKSKAIMSTRELQDLEDQQRSLKSKMDSLRNKDLANSVQRKVKSQYWEQVKEGKKGHFMKRSDQRKLIQVEKYKGMKKRQVDKVIERKRKKTLAKEYKRVEFLKR